MKKIILLGYMGSGKTTLGSLLSKKLKIKHIDLDHIIENKFGISINEIFETKGEIFFRKWEHHYLKEILDSNDSFILSLGGGTPCYADNHLFFNQENILSIYLKASIETLCERLTETREKRPLVASKSKEELKDFIAKHLFDRSFYYHQAKFVINIDDKSSIEIIEEIEKLLT